MRTVKQGLLERHMVGGEISKLSAYTGHAVWMREMEIVIDDEGGHRDFLAEGVTRVHAKHKVGRVICSPGPGVREIVLGVERVVSNQTVEQARLQRQALTNWRQVGQVRKSEVAQPIRAANVRRRCREAEVLRVLARLHRQLHAPTGVFRSEPFHTGTSHIQIQFVHFECRAAIAEQVVGGMIEV